MRKDTGETRTKAWDKGHFSLEGSMSQLNRQGRAAWRPQSSDDRAKDSFQGVMNWPKKRKHACSCFR